MASMLIVEDDAAWRALYLTEFGKDFHVVEASDGLEALSLLDWIQPDVILLDLRLPRMDGPTFLRELERKGVRVPVVICSGVLPEEGATSKGALLAPKSADLRYVRSAVRAVVQSPERLADAVADSALSQELEWRD